jgi:hypothetical protein
MESAPIKSKALEVNLACTRVDMSIDEHFIALYTETSD